MKRKNPLANNLGSISSGTMRPADVLPELVSTLEYQKPLKREHRKLLKEIDARQTDQGEAYWDDGDADTDIEELFDALNEYCMPYFYFGAHPGDGSDYGFWLSDMFEYDFDGLKVGSTSEVPTGYSGEVLHVNDHGNMTLYSYSRGRSREVWGLV